MNADELMELWVERAKLGEHVELPWQPLRSTLFRGGTPEDGWRRMVVHFAEHGVAVKEERRTHGDSVKVWAVLSRLH